MTDAKTMDIAEVVYDYIKNGDQDTPREECIKWIKFLLAEATASMFTEEQLFPLWQWLTETERMSETETKYWKEQFSGWLEQYRKEKHGTTQAV